MLSLAYGPDATIDLELEGQARVTYCPAPRGTPLLNVAAAVRAALAAPLGFPPLKQIAMPGDQVVLAVAPGVSRAATAIAAAVESLLSAGVAPANIGVVLAPGSAGVDQALAELPAEVREKVTALVHNPRDRQRLSYLAATTAAQPVYLQRAIHDADLVVSIGMLQLAGTPGYHGIFSSIFPTFSDAGTLARFRAPKAMRVEEQQRLCSEADEVGWLLGTRFTVQFVPGANDDVLAVLAGEPQAVFDAGTKQYEKLWSFEVPERVEMFVGTLGGDAAQHTWENVGRALVSAARVLSDHGDVIICSQVNQAPGPGMERMIGADDLQVALREIAREKPHDSLAAAQLGEALERGRVYLVSQLADELVEEMGIYPLEADNVARVIGRYESCVVVANAHHARVWPRGEEQKKNTRSRKQRR